MRTHKPDYALLLITLLASVLLFWKLGSHNLMQYDEARNGANAWYMYHNHDYVNYYYGNALDTWNAKPPLLIWLITISYHLFGFNEFSLRLPSVLASLAFFIVFYQLVKKNISRQVAIYSSIILLACRAVIGEHVGRNGDFDSLLLLFLTCSLYYFCEYALRNKKYAIYWVAIFLGLAFYSKGTASVLYLPGMFVFLLITGRLADILKDYRLYLSLVIFLAIAGSWILLVSLYGTTFETSVYGSKNSIETMLLYDTVKRFTTQELNPGEIKDNLFFIHAIEVRMNMWHILFYTAVATGLYRLFRKDWKYQENNMEQRFTLLLICLMVPVILIVNFGQYVLDWYFAPAWILIAIIVAQWMAYIQQKWKPAAYLWVLVIGFNLVKHFLYMDTRPDTMHHVFSKNNTNLSGQDYIVVQGTPDQDVVLYLLWLGVDFYKTENDAELQQLKGKIALVQAGKFNDNDYKLISRFDGYCLAEIK
ncbi:MAG: glycosyltransferase family 39 protein [Chitinophagales bacterium]|nr:glycosyltransferase family 39 protein [Chitinophagales bacterium]